MIDNKLKRLEMYKNKLQDLIESAKHVTPKKHAHRVLQYKRFLFNELETVKGQIDAIKLGAVK